VAATAASRAVAPSSVVVRIRTAMEWLWLGAIVLVPIIMMPDTLAVGFIQMPKVFVFRTIALALVALWSLEWSCRPALDWPWRGGRVWFRLRAWLRDDPAHWIVAGALAVFAITIMGTLASPVPHVSLWGIDPGWDTYALHSVAGYLAIFLVMAAHIRTETQIRRILTAFVIVGVVASVYGLGQHFGYDLFREMAQDNTRARLTLGNPIFAGAVLAMTIPVTMVLLLQFRDRVGPLTHIFVFSLPLAIQIAALLFTLSRGPWFGSIVAASVTLVLIARQFGREMLTRALAMGSISLAVAMLISLIPAGGVLATDEQSTVGGRLAGIVEETTTGGLSSRLVIWRTAGRTVIGRPWADTDAYPELPDLRAQSLRPIIGYGPDMFPYAYQFIGETRATSSLVSHGHNFLVHIAVELGLLGVLAYLSLLAGAVLVLARMLRDARSGRYSFGFTLLVVAAAGSVAGRVGEQLTGKAQVSDLVMMWAVLAVIVALARFARAEPASEDNNAPPMPRRRPRQAARETTVVAWTPDWRIGTALAVIFVVAFLWWQATARPVIASFEARNADEAFAAGQLIEAFAHIDRAQKWHPAATLFYVRKANAASSLARHQPTPEATLQQMLEADHEAREALEGNPLDQRVWLLRAGLSLDIALLQGGTDVAAASVDEALHVNELITNLLPGYWQAFALLALANVRLGLPEEGLTLAKESIAIAGETANASQPYFIKGSALRDLERFDEAVAAFETSITLAPNEPAIGALRELQEATSASGTP